VRPHVSVDAVKAASAKVGMLEEGTTTVDALLQLLTV
jgi:hypothetical protein